MDPESARLVRDEIASLRSSQRSIVICTHNLAEAEALADIVAIIYRGRILTQGTLDELKQHILGPAEYELQLSEAWNPDGLDLPRGVILNHRNGKSIRFGVECPEESNPQLIHALSDQRAPVIAFQEVPRTLEQVYLQVMAEAQMGRGYAK
jgi:ABC-2 type transport system ATP-binding protein